MTAGGLAPYHRGMSEARKLREALRKAITATWKALRDERPDDPPYAFGLYVTRDVLFIGPTAGSEAGLASLSADGSPSDRWALNRSPLHLWGEDRFERVQSLLAERPDPYELEGEAFDAEIRARMEACFGALKALDDEGLFGEGEARHRLLLNVFSADESDRQRLENAARLNPPEALEALEPALEIREPTGAPQLLGAESVLQIGALAARGGLLVAAGTSGELIGWSVDGETIEERFSLRDEDEHWAVAIGVTGAVLYGSTTGIRRRELERPEPPELLHEGAKVTQLVVAPDGSVLVADEDFERLVAIGEDRREQWRREPGGRPLAMSRDGSAIAAAGKNHESIRLLDPATGEERAMVPASHVSAAAFGPEGDLIAAANREAVALHERTNGWAAAHEWAVEASANALAFSPSGAHLAAVFDDGTLKVWDVATKAAVLDVHGRQEALLALAWIDDQRVAAGGRDPERGPPVYVWRLP
jgi:hypothetical protein